MIIEAKLLQSIIESALMAYGQPLTIEKLQTLFIDDKENTKSSVSESKRGSNEEVAQLKDSVNKDSANKTSYLASNDEEGTESPPKKVINPDEVPSKQAILEALESIQKHCEERGFELKKVSSGWRFQVRADMAVWVNRLWEEKPQRYSRALLETLSIIAYRQPITRGDIEEIRGVAVSSHIIKTLSEREWIKVIGHRDVPGRPSLFATTKQFLDYFNLESLDELPSLRELADIETINPELDLQGENNQTDSNQAGPMASGAAVLELVDNGSNEPDKNQVDSNTEVNSSEENSIEVSADQTVDEIGSNNIVVESESELTSDYDEDNISEEGSRS